MIVGCYTLHLYCDGPGCRHGEFGARPMFAEISGDESGTAARRAARKVGWTLNMKNNTAICPACQVAIATATPQQSASPSPPQASQDTARISAPPIPTSPDTNNQEK